MPQQTNKKSKLFQIHFSTYRGKRCAKYMRVKTELSSVLEANSPRFPPSSRVSKQRAPSEASSPFAQPGGCSLRARVSRAQSVQQPTVEQNLIFKPQKARPLHPVICLSKLRHGEPQVRMQCGVRTGSQEGEHCQQAQKGSHHYSGGKDFSFFLLLQE